MGVAYRLLGSVSETEDVVQDTALRWLALDPPLPERPIAWLTTVCTNRCLDILRSSHHKRMDYVGPWLPDSLVTESASDAAQHVELASSLSTAFLLMLERLTPRERAAYLLHDIFDMEFAQIAETLDLTPANCRQLAARARKMIRRENARFVPDLDRQRELFESFRSALDTGSIDQLAQVLSQDVDLRADSDGKVVAVRHVVDGFDAVSDFIAGTLGPAWSQDRFDVEMANGHLVLAVRRGPRLTAIVAFGYAQDGAVNHVFIQRNPDKLRVFEHRAASAAGDGSLWIA